MWCFTMDSRFCFQDLFFFNRLRPTKIQEESNGTFSAGFFKYFRSNDISFCYTGDNWWNYNRRYPRADLIYGNNSSVADGV